MSDWIKQQLQLGEKQPVSSLHRVWGSPARSYCLTADDKMRLQIPTDFMAEASLGHNASFATTESSHTTGSVGSEGPRGRAGCWHHGLDLPPGSFLLQVLLKLTTFRRPYTGYFQVWDALSPEPTEASRLCSHSTGSGPCKGPGGVGGGAVALADLLSARHQPASVHHLTLDKPYFHRRLDDASRMVGICVNSDPVHNSLQGLGVLLWPVGHHLSEQLGLSRKGNLCIMFFTVFAEPLPLGVWPPLQSADLGSENAFRSGN